MALTSLQLARAFPHAKPAAINALQPELQGVLDRYEINTPNRVAMFLAQTCYESEYFSRTAEDLDYRWQQLLLLFPTHFPTVAVAKQYDRKPEAIANRLYAGRMGNGDEASGDGWRWRGHGYIQVTGKDNHTRAGKDLGVPLDEVADWLQTPKGAITSAGWFWGLEGLNRFADQKNVGEVTRLINGGYTGLSDRQKLFDQALKAFA